MRVRVCVSECVCVCVCESECVCVRERERISDSNLFISNEHFVEIFRRIKKEKHFFTISPSLDIELGKSRYVKLSTKIMFLVHLQQQQQ